jgi:hypothetical protein
LRSGISKPPVPEQRLINRLHAEKMKRRKDAAEAKVERKRKAKHDKACKLARAEGKPRPATPESLEEEEEEEVASDAKDHALRGDEEAAGASPPPFYLWDDDEGEPVAPEVTRAVAESLAHPSLEGAERGSSPLAAGEETTAPQVPVHGDEAAAGEESSVLAASSHQADTRGAPSGQSSRGGTVTRARRSATRKRSMSARSG